MILVPMTVEALIVNRFGNSREYADIAVNYELLNGVSLLGGVIEPQPFKKRAAPGAGVHLHFILPDGLTPRAWRRKMALTIPQCRTVTL